ncbi:MAG: ABC transporter ATP-binding protein/permease, partial [Proteobacteria bacterium]|nr:ABC transporter ATP-binding protein/permease [Pseudomonadota bacterium]
WPVKKNRLRFLFALSCFLLVGARLANLYPPLLFKEIVDNLSIKSQGEALLVTSFFMILGYTFTRFLSQLTSGLKDATFSPVTQNAMHRIALEVFCKLHRLGLRFHLDRKMGGTGRALERGIKGIETFMRFTIFMLAPSFVEITAACALLWHLYGFTMAAIAVVTLSLYITFTVLYSQWRLKVVRKLAEIDSGAGGHVVESLLQYESVKYFGNEAAEAKRYDTWLSRYEKTAIHTQWTLSVLDIVQGLIIAVGLSAALILTARQMSLHTITVGDFVLVNTLLLQLFVPLWSLGFAYREVKLALINMDEMFDLMNETEEIQDAPDAHDLPRGTRGLAFEDVCFSYHSERPILKNLTFTVEPGQTVAIVGPSGAGKSTLLKLLLRFYDVCGGRVLVGGHDVRTLTQASLRAAVGVVPQDTVLFNESIFFNIAYAREGATREEVEEAARGANIHERIMSFPQGYDALVGERGLKLSGGEKQRIAIARALLKKPDIYFFDEATSSLDSHTEKEIQKNLDMLASITTTIIVAHRLSTVVGAHKILVLDAGQIVEEGTHASLLEHKGLYASLWQKQQHEKEVEETLA